MFITNIKLFRSSQQLKNHRIDPDIMSTVSFVDRSAPYFQRNATIFDEFLYRPFLHFINEKYAFQLLYSYICVFFLRIVKKWQEYFVHNHDSTENTKYLLDMVQCTTAQIMSNTSRDVLIIVSNSIYTYYYISAFMIGMLYSRC